MFHTYLGVIKDIRSRGECQLSKFRFRDYPEIETRDDLLISIDLNSAKLKNGMMILY